MTGAPPRVETFLTFPIILIRMSIAAPHPLSYTVHPVSRTTSDNLCRLQIDLIGNTLPPEQHQPQVYATYLDSIVSSKVPKNGRFPKSTDQIYLTYLPTYIPDKLPSEQLHPQVYATYLDSIVSSKVPKNGWFPKKSKIFLEIFFEKNTFFVAKKTLFEG